MSKRFDIVAIGEAMVEFNQTSAPGNCTYLQGFGGDTSNAVIAAARQGARCAYMTRLGDDEFGRMCLALWASEGVDCSAIEIDPSAVAGRHPVFACLGDQPGHQPQCEGRSAACD
jgi:2-dehydro-3-deoxygluconokinase